MSHEFPQLTDGQDLPEIVVDLNPPLPEIGVELESLEEKEQRENIDEYFQALDCLIPVAERRITPDVVSLANKWMRIGIDQFNGDIDSSVTMTIDYYKEGRSNYDFIEALKKLKNQKDKIENKLALSETIKAARRGGDFHIARFSQLK